MQYLMGVDEAEAIALLDGTRTVSLRQQAPTGLAVGDRVYVWTDDRIVGSFTVENVMRGSAMTIAKRFAARAGLAPREAFEQLNSGGQATAIAVTEPVRFEGPVALPEHDRAAGTRIVPV